MKQDKDQEEQGSVTNFTPFYSEVDIDVQREIQFRSSVSLANNRTSDQLEWMTSRTSWGSITILQSDNETVRAAINNKSLRINNTPSNKFSNIVGSQINDLRTSIKNFSNSARSYNATDPDYLASSYINTRSGRSGPSLQRIYITLADTSHGAQGLLNEAQVEILVPDIEQFINEFDSTWFRVGARIIVEIGHSVRLDEYANYGQFDGRLVNFDFSYEENGSVRVMLYIKATTELFTNISARKTSDNLSTVVATENKTLIDIINDLIKQYAPGDSAIYKNASQGGVVSVLPIDFDANYLTDKNNTTNNLEVKYQNRHKLLGLLNKLKIKKSSPTEQELQEAEQPYYSFVARIPKDKTVIGSISNTDLQGTESGLRDYISLSTLIKILNTMINNTWSAESKQEKDAKNKNGNGSTKLEASLISVHPDYSSTKLYDFNVGAGLDVIVSADHTQIILPGTDAYPTDTYTSQLAAQLADSELFASQNEQQKLLDDVANFDLNLNEPTTLVPNQQPSFVGRSQYGRFTSVYNNETIDVSKLAFYQTIGDVTLGYVAHILISTELIENIFEQAKHEAEKKEVNDKQFTDITITILLNRLASVIRSCTGNAIDLRLVELPVEKLKPSKDNLTVPKMLVFRDMTTTIPENQKASNVFKLPMFTNSLVTSAVATNLLKENQSAETSAYKRIGTVVRKFNIKGKLPNSFKNLTLVVSQFSGSPDKLGPLIKYIEAETPDDKKAVEDEINEKRNKAFGDLVTAKLNYAKIVDYETAKSNLKTALEAAVVYSKSNVAQLSKFNAPIYPLDVEIELDGIYGFRYGDVISIDGLPPRYNNFVFCIVKINHTLTNQDWVTSLTCFMRPRID